MRIRCVLLAGLLAVAAPPVTASASSDSPAPEDRCQTRAKDYSTAGYEGGTLDTALGYGPSAGEQPVDDPLFPHQWHLQAVGVPEAWARGALGRHQRIAFLETGVDLNHPDLRDKIAAVEDFVHDAGPSPTCHTKGADGHGHGTMDIGLAVAETDNGQGVAGVAPLADALVARIPDSVSNKPDERAALTRRVAEAVDWSVSQGADVINLSLGQAHRALWELVPGAGEQPGPLLAAALDRAEEAGVVVVASAQNVPLGAPSCDHPADLPTVICVAGVDRKGLPVAHSTHPLKSQGVAVRAPGSSFAAPPPQSRPCHRRSTGHHAEVDRPVMTTDVLWTTIHPRFSRDTCMPVPGYGPAAGSTSQSAPIVSGIAALLTGRNLSPADVRACLVRTSSQRGAYDPVWGHGVVHAGTAVRECHPGLSRRTGDPAERLVLSP